MADPGLFLLAHEKELIKHVIYSSSSTSSSSSESSFDTQPRNIKKRRKYYENRVEKFCPKKQPHNFRQKRFVKKRKGSDGNPILVSDSESD